MLVKLNVNIFRYSEALELYKSLNVKTNSKHDYIITIASVLVGKIKDNISSNNKSNLNKKVFSNEGKCVFI